MKLNLFLCCVAVLASTMISSAQGNMLTVTVSAAFSVRSSAAF